MNGQRAEAVRQDVVYRLKLMELLHLGLLSFLLSDTGACPGNELGLGVGRFTETLPGATVHAVVVDPSETETVLLS